jgi:hypothetical protein
MTTFEIAYLVIKAVFILVIVYFIIYPQKVPTNSLNLNATKMRIVLSVALVLIIGGIALRFDPFGSTQTSAQITNDQKTKISDIEKALQAKISTYPEDSKTNSWSKACQTENTKNSLAQTPNLPVSTAELISLAVCACMTEKIKDLPEFKVALDLTSAGKPFIEATDTAFSKKAGFEDMVKPCSDIVTE